MKTLPSLILISILGIATHASQNGVIVSDNPSTKKAQEKRNAVTKKPDIKASKKKDFSHGKDIKPKTKLDKDQHKYPGVEWSPKDRQNKYPGVEWKPKNGDPIPHQDRNSYPGVEWTPKK